ncbi:VRK3 kinase, partial [Atractosteus spatula]|nr:VRK3 kinase [Atractosteus spatula]
MILHYCPQCGSKLQAGFKFCPSCGQKLPTEDPEEAAASAISQVTTSDPPVSDQCISNISFLFTNCENSTPVKMNPLTLSYFSSFTSEGQSSPAHAPALTPPRRTRLTAAKVKVEEEVSSRTAASLSKSPKSLPGASRAPLSPRKRQASPRVKQEEESTAEASPSPKSPLGAKSTPKRARRMCIEPLQESELLTDTAGRKWRLIKLLSQSDSELLYGVQQITAGAPTADYKYTLKLAAKDGKIFKEQNFLQRAAKPTLGEFTPLFFSEAVVEKWMKSHKLNFLGIPTCVGFGLHADTYRFLIFQNMGQSLQFILDEKTLLLSEKAVLQLCCRILDVLEYIHENEYVHADIQAENVYLNPAEPKQVYLAGYHHAFRYCPGGKQVEYREGSQTAHEGAVEFISIDSHKGAGPSRRSDLQALGYCMLKWHTGTLPWTHQAGSPSKVLAEKERYKTDVGGLLAHCFGRKRVPAAVQIYLSQVMALQYNEKPDYLSLRKLMTDALQQLGTSLDQPIDVQSCLCPEAGSASVGLSPVSRQGWGEGAGELSASAGAADAPLLGWLVCAKARFGHQKFQFSFRQGASGGRDELLETDPGSKLTAASRNKGDHHRKDQRKKADVGYGPMNRLNKSTQPFRALYTVLEGKKCTGRPWKKKMDLPREDDKQKQKSMVETRRKAFNKLEAAEKLGVCRPAVRLSSPLEREEKGVWGAETAAGVCIRAASVESARDSRETVQGFLPGSFRRALLGRGMSLFRGYGYTLPPLPMMGERPGIRKTERLECEFGRAPGYSRGPSPSDTRLNPLTAGLHWPGQQQIAPASLSSEACPGVCAHCPLAPWQSPGIRLAFRLLLQSLRARARDNPRTGVREAELLQEDASRVYFVSAEAVDQCLSACLEVKVQEYFPLSDLELTDKAFRGLAPQYQSELLLSYSPPHDLHVPYSGLPSVPRARPHSVFDGAVCCCCSPEL